MNLVLLTAADFFDKGRVRLTGRRFEHIRKVHRAGVGDTLRVGLRGGNRGTGVVQSMTDNSIELGVVLTEVPPEPSPVTLLLALPRPKSFRRTIQCAVTMGVKRIALFGAYRVERSYWQTPWLGETELQEQVVLGLEQARDTLLPVITLHPLFKPFIEDTAPELVRGTRRLLAHPEAGTVCPSALAGGISLAIGPEGGFTDYELDRFACLGFEPVSIGPRILRTEQAVPAFLGRLMAPEAG